jgi:hypothetical protein
MTESRAQLRNRRLRTPRAAATAGVIFAVLMGTNYALIRISVPPDNTLWDEWMDKWALTITVALNLVPFAGIAFLWFMGVLRDRMGHLEDQFFSTLVFGSGFLYLGMTFTASALIGGIATMYAADPSLLEERGLYAFASVVSYRIHGVYAIRMAGMFMLALGTMWVRTHVMPRWQAVLTFALALLLLLGIGYNRWLVMVFPAWVFVISAYILLLTYRYGDGDSQGA